MTRSLRARYGEWALVAGASQGFGASFAAELAGQGMNVALVSRQGDRLGELAQRLCADRGVEARCLVFDLAEQDAAAAIGNAVSDFDLGILIYNAAYVPVGRFLETGEEALEQVVRVNVRGPLLLARSMEVRGSGDADAFLDVSYHDFLAAPIEEVRRIYRRAGIEFTAAAEKAAVSLSARDVKDRHGKHDYSLSIP